MMVLKTPKHDHTAFTLVELLVALTVTGIVLTAVAALTLALGAANDSSNDVAEEQARLRYTRLRISELIRKCKLVCATPGNDIVIWKTDKNNDGKINPGELVYIESGLSRDRIRLLEFSPRDGWFAKQWFENHSFTIQDIKSGQAKVLLWFWCKWDYITLIPQCSNVQFLLDTAAPQTRFVSISFDLDESGVTHHYQINTALRAWAGNLLDSNGEIVDTDDD